MLRSVFTTLLFFCILALNAQSKINISGSVADSFGHLIPNASIFCNSRWVTLSNSNGYFTFKTSPDKTYSLKISCIGYQTKTLDTSSSADGIDIKVILHSSPVQLQNVDVIFKTTPQLLVNIPGYNIKDYLITDEYILVLAYMNNESSSELFLLDKFGNIHDNYKPDETTGKANFLRKDNYTNFLHLFCNNEMLRINIIGNKLHLIPTDIYIYYGFIRPVVDTISGNLFVSDYNAYYTNHSYYLINKQEKLQNRLCVIRDEGDKKDLYNFSYFKLDSSEIIERAGLEIPKYDKRVYIETVSGGGDGQNIKFGPGYTKNLWLIETEKDRDFTPAPGFKIHDTICVFNFPSNRLYHYYRNGVVIDSLIISFHKSKSINDFEKIMLIDRSTSKLYAVFKKNGNRYLKQIDWRTGNTIATYSTDIAYPNKIWINNGYIYYINKKQTDSYSPGLYKEFISDKIKN